MKKPIIYIVILIAIIIFGVAIAVKVTNDFKVTTTSSNNISNNNTANEKQNIIANEINNEDNNIIENGIKENTEPEEPKTDLEKAIDIVKEDFGNNSNVYYAQDGKTANDEFIICVRDKNSTAALAWYTVNIEDGTFTRE